MQNQRQPTTKNKMKQEFWIGLLGFSMMILSGINFAINPLSAISVLEFLLICFGAGYLSGRLQDEIK